MPPHTTQFLTHRFDGGWAPDFGNLVSGLPLQTGQVTIPYVLTAENIFWQLDGGFRKVGGTTQLGSELESGAVIYGLYDYWRIGTSGSATRRKICHVGTTIKEDQDTDTWQNLFTGLESAKHPNYATFNDLLIIASDSNTDVPKSWDQTTAQNLAGSPPNFAFSVEHKNRQWCAGAVANPSRLYYSAADDPEDWTGAGSGTIDISPGDGDEIRGIASFKNELWVFKGPYKGSIHRISGSTPQDFTRTTFIQGLPCVSHSTITQFRDDILFMTPSGSIRSLKATAAFGDYNDAAITFPINEWLIDNLNKSVLKKAWVVNDPTTSRLYVAVPTGSNTTNNTVLCYDYQFTSIQRPDRWSRITAWNAHSLAGYILNGLPRVMGGGRDGYVRNLNVAARSLDGSTSIDVNMETPFLNYGPSSQKKTLMQVGLTLSPKGGDNVIVEWERDSLYVNSETLDQGGEGVQLGDAGSPSGDDFMLDEDTLGGVTFSEVYGVLDDGGDFRWIQYRIKQQVAGDDLHLHALSVGIQPGAFSTE